MLYKRFLLVVLIAGFVITPLAANADAYTDLQQTKTAFETAHSWHGVEQLSGGRTIIIDHVAPDRWRIQPTPNMTEILVGSDLYLVRDGKSMHMPFVMPQIQQLVNQNWLAVDPEVKKTAKDLGVQPINGMTLHAYSFTSKGTTVKLYLSKDHLPAVAVTTSSNGTVTITYSGYNSAITINP